MRIKQADSGDCWWYAYGELGSSGCLLLLGKLQ